MSRTRTVQRRWLNGECAVFARVDDGPHDISEDVIPPSRRLQRELVAHGNRLQLPRRVGLRRVCQLLLAHLEPVGGVRKQVNAGLHLLCACFITRRNQSLTTRATQTHCTARRLQPRSILPKELAQVVIGRVSPHRPASVGPSLRDRLSTQLKLEIACGGCVSKRKAHQRKREVRCRCDLSDSALVRLARAARWSSGLLSAWEAFVVSSTSSDMAAAFESTRSSEPIGDISRNGWRVKLSAHAAEHTNVGWPARTMLARRPSEG